MGQHSLHGEYSQYLTAQRGRNNLHNIVSTQALNPSNAATAWVSLPRRRLPTWGYNYGRKPSSTLDTLEMTQVLNPQNTTSVWVSHPSKRLAMWHNIPTGHNSKHSLEC